MEVNVIAIGNLQQGLQPDAPGTCRVWVADRLGCTRFNSIELRCVALRPVPDDYVSKHSICDVPDGETPSLDSLDKSTSCTNPTTFPKDYHSRSPCLVLSLVQSFEYTVVEHSAALVLSFTLRRSIFIDLRLLVWGSYIFTCSSRCDTS